MIIKLFKLFESRTSEITDDEFRNIMKSDCKDFIKNPCLLQRTKKKLTSRFSFIDPSKFTRSAFKDEGVGVLSNHHLLLMDNLPSWQDFPRRSKSIIGNTNEHYGSEYGTHRYLVIPFDGAKFGLAPSEDLWTSYSDINSELSISFDDTFSKMMKRNEISDNSYEEMMHDMQNMYDEFIYKSLDVDSITQILLKRLYILFEEFRKTGYTDIEKALSDYLAPSEFNHEREKYRYAEKKDGFKIVYYDYIVKIEEYKKFEFWTESPCLLYYLGTGNINISAEFEKFLKDFIR
jgi:hypothetical protein